MTVPISYIGGCVSQGALSAAPESYWVKSYCGWVNTITLDYVEALSLPVDTAAWTDEARSIFRFENSGRYIQVVKNLSDLVLIDFLRDFSKPVIRLSDGRILSWQYAYNRCDRARADVVKLGTIIEPDTEVFFDIWARAVKSLVGRIQPRVKALLVALPEPALLQVENGVVRPYTEGFTSYEQARLIPMIARANHWLRTTLSAIPNVHFLTPGGCPLTTTEQEEPAWLYHYTHETKILLSNQIHAVAASYGYIESPGTIRTSA